MITENLTPNKKYSWFDLYEPRPDNFERLSNEFGLSQLLLQDTLRPEHLPKYEYTEKGHFLMLRGYDPKCNVDATTVQELTRKIALFITDSNLLSIHRANLHYLPKLIEKAQKNEEPRTIQGLAHSIIITVIRSYEEPINAIQEMYEEFETDVLAKKMERLDINRIYHFRRQTFLIKRMLKQTNDALYRSKEFWVEHPSLLQDLRENTDQLYFQLDEIASNFEHLFALHISLNDQRANEVMKILTVFSTILLPLNFLASFYGMNFTTIPGLNSLHALITLILTMIIISILSIWYFKRKGWFNTSDE